MAALAFVGGLEQLCTIGVPLQLAMQLHSGLGLALLKRVTALQQRISEASAQVALRFLHIVSTLVQFAVQTVALHEETPVDVRLPPDAIREPAALLRQEQAQLFNPILTCGYELVLHGLQQTTLCQLPSLAQLRHLWAQLCWEWTAQLAEGMRPSWMSAYPGPTRDEARQLQLQALAAMRSLRPSHPLTAGRAVFTRFAGALPGPSGFDLVCSGLQQAAAAGGPHGSSMFTAEFAFGKIQY